MDGHRQRHVFVGYAQKQLSTDTNFHWINIFSDEVYFYMNGLVNNRIPNKSGVVPTQVKFNSFQCIVKRSLLVVGFGLERSSIYISLKTTLIKPYLTTANIVWSLITNIFWFAHGTFDIPNDWFEGMWTDHRECEIWPRYIFF